MRNRLLALFAVAASLLVVSGPLLAHHGTAAYDMTEFITLKGTVTDFDWSNPHCFVHFDVKDEKGNVERWAADSPSPARLARAGWNRDVLKPGDQITAVGNRAKDGSHFIRLAKIVLPTGQELTGYTHF